MKKLLLYKLAAILLLTACTDLDIDPTSSVGTGNFFQTQKDLEIAVNDLYQSFLFKIDNDEWGDDHFLRGSLTTPITNSTINSETNFVNFYWKDLYKGISRSTTLLESMSGAEENTSPEVFSRVEGEARCLRAWFYSILISHYGDVVFYDKTISLSNAYTIPRTNKSEILAFIYDEFDAAASLLPASYATNEVKRVSKGTALGLKARIALYMGDYTTAKAASQAVMELGVHSLYRTGGAFAYRNLFLKPGETSSEIIFSSPNSIANNSTYTNNANTRNFISRLGGGFGAWIPAWSAVDIYECTDGLPIDESPLYDPHDPFSNRDPRLTMNIVEFGTPWLGFTYQPHPDSVKVFSQKLGKQVNNNDNRAVAQFASYTGFLWKKRVDQDWSDNLLSENANIVLRYADVLLMYAESKIETNDIDASVLEAINDVRSRAYGVDISSTGAYPEITTTDQAALRKILRRERRVELMLEGLRYMDLIRWGLANKALNVEVPGLNQPASIDRTQWPFNDVILPDIDDDGVILYENIITAGYARKLTDYLWDPNKQNLWPVPAAERVLNSELGQNTGY